MGFDAGASSEDKLLERVPSPEPAGLVKRAAARTEPAPVYSARAASKDEEGKGSSLSASPERKEIAELPETLPVVNLESRPEEPLVAALRLFLDRRSPEAIELLKSYDRASQEVLLCLLPLAVRVSDKGLDRASPQAVAATIDQLECLTIPLRPRAALRIERLCFCRSIKRFGVYEPVAEQRPTFQGGCDGRPGAHIQVYAEVENFAHEMQGSLHLTRLATSAEIRDIEGKVRWQHEFPAQADISRSPRHDYFIAYQFCVPPNLPPGPYTLWIQVKDVLTQPPRSARRSLDFQVVPAGGLGRQGDRGR
jgi:hypothetical protein